MSRIEYGFTCGEFSIAVSGNGLLLPGSKNQTLKKNLIPYCNPKDAVGIYTFRAASNEKVICEIPVNVYWVTHPNQPQPFLGIQPELESAENLRNRFSDYLGKEVHLKFTPMNPEVG